MAVGRLQSAIKGDRDMIKKKAKIKCIKIDITYRKVCAYRIVKHMQKNSLHILLLNQACKKFNSS